MSLPRHDLTKPHPEEKRAALARRVALAAWERTHRMPGSTVPAHVIARDVGLDLRSAEFQAALSLAADGRLLTRRPGRAPRMPDDLGVQSAGVLGLRPTGGPPEDRNRWPENRPLRRGAQGLRPTGPSEWKL